MSTTPKETTPVSPTNNYVATVDKAADDQVPAAVQIDVASVPLGANVDANGLVLGKWKTDIFGCFNDLVPNCLLATFCPCVSLAQTLHRIGMYSFNTVLMVFGAMYLLYLIFYIIQMSATSTVSLNSFGYPVVSAAATFWWYIALAVQVAAFVMFMLIRIRVRKAFQIPGSELEDCACSFFCSCCVLAQMASHTESYTPNQCSFSPKDTLPGYEF
ncbi:hypothetical protein H310_04353 [Aphanomyces invadans]|uniref:PLAC8 family protein n=1 Tax=Aphanomyces invadans TaxID=157072 RepID=A0A024UDJ7_9STRA|nr:hypothetical protein H310_04353 [Aphanomyces invadans]ETW03937.1 hypothetical protein H310_04353 [Aphanomyces invadans]|eukprot:XP_008866893.1 hypothetical protein H310_04353 [Aphanomyces invadans]